MNFLLLLIIWIISALISTLLWPYSLNTWLVFFGNEPAVLWWHGLLLGLVPGVGQAVLPVAAVTWILMLFLV